jgi:hypothetical protein
MRSWLKDSERWTVKQLIREPIFLPLPLVLYCLARSGNFSWSVDDPECLDEKYQQERRPRRIKRK